jgi:predicted membrane protein
MDNIENDEITESHHKKRWILPVVLLLVGIGLLLNQLGLELPFWLITWPMLLIVVGIIRGVTSGFRDARWFILILIGGIFLVDEIIPGISFHRFLWPLAIIAIGLYLLIKPRNFHRNRHWDDWHRTMRNNRAWKQGGEQNNFAGSGRSFSSDSFIDATTVFGGVNRTIVSKDFKGGDITVFMGGTEINLSQADINGTARLDITQIMGGTKLIVPPHWEIRSELTSVFGNIEDKRQQTAVTNPDKVLIIDGTSIFGGIEIRNY